MEAVVLALDHAAVVGGIDRLDVALECRWLIQLSRLIGVDADLAQHRPVAPDRLVLHLHVGVEGDERAVREPGERVDLGQRHVVVPLQAGQPGEHRGRAVQLRARHPAAGHGLLGLEVGDRVEVGEVAATDVVGVLFGDLFDVDPAHVREEHHRPLRPAVPEHRGVVLLLDLGLRVDEHADRHVAADLELEDLGGVRLGLLGAVGELDPAGLHPPAGQDLRFDHGRARDPLGRLPGFGCGGGEAVVGDRDPRPLDDSA